MRILLFIVVAFALMSCRKEEVRRDVQLGASCRMCAVQFDNGEGTIGHDTIIGQITWTYQAGCNPVPDTAIGTGRWNIVVTDGSTVFIEACHLRTDTADGDINLTAIGGIDPITTNAIQPEQCARIQQPAIIP